MSEGSRRDVQSLGHGPAREISVSQLRAERDSPHPGGALLGALRLLALARFLLP